MRACSLVLLAILTGSTAHGAPPARKCAAAELDAAGLTVYRKTRCQETALFTGKPVRDACVSAADRKLADSIDAAERSGRCETAGDPDALRVAGDACVASYVAAIAGDRRCAAAKMSSKRSAPTRAATVVQLRRDLCELSGGLRRLPGDVSMMQ